MQQQNLKINSIFENGNSFKCINVPFNQLPQMNNFPQNLTNLIVPIKPPFDIPNKDWKKWWNGNKFIYGSRDYYEYIGYPLWWLDLYYPENNIPPKQSIKTKLKMESKFKMEPELKSQRITEINNQKNNNNLNNSKIKKYKNYSQMSGILSSFSSMILLIFFLLL